MNEQQIPVQPGSVADDEIDLIGLVKTIWHGRKTILYSILTGALLGIFVALSLPNEYTATAILVPQLGVSQSKVSGLGGLAALAGINLNTTDQSADLSPMVYPQIANSLPFKLELMNTSFNFSEFSEPVTLFDYYTKYRKPSVLECIKKYTIGLPGMVIEAMKGTPKESALPKDSPDQPILLSKKQYAVKNTLDALVSLDAGSKQGYLTLSVRMPEAVAAAQIGLKAQNMLQRYVTEFKIEKAKSTLWFIQERYNESKDEFEDAQDSLTVVNYRNKNLKSGLSRIETERIQTRYTIAFGIFQELSKQLEQAKIQVREETPVFTVIEPISVPTEKSKPNRTMILLIWIFLGGVIGVGIVFGRKFFDSIKKQWNEK